MTIQLLLFASYRDQVGQREMRLELSEPLTVRQVAKKLQADYPDLSLKGALCALNERYVSPEQEVKGGDTLAFFPPVSGGEIDPLETDHLFVTEGVLDLAHLHALAVADPYGAVASFVGTVRSPNAGQAVTYIDYEGYEAMILTQMKVVTGELRERFDLGKVVISHRLGRLKPSEASIAIVISSKHRRPALEAAHACIDRIKELLPVWKREVTSSGEVWVEGSSVAGKTL